MKKCKKWIALLVIGLLLVTTPTAYALEAKPMDTTQLEELLEIAACVDPEDYSDEAWEMMVEAVDYANEAMASGNQLKVNNAVGKLAKALAQKGMNYDALNAAIAQAQDFLQENAFSWGTLHQQIVDAQKLYGAGDQAAVDAAAESICLSIQQLQSQLDHSQTEVPVEEEPEAQEPQVVRKSPVVWIVLLCISLAGNVAVAVWFLWNKRSDSKKQVDDVPLVDYDIDDDLV